MSDLVLLIVFIALGAVVLGSHRFRGLRVASRVLSVVGFLFFGLISLACVYGMFALGDKGAGVLLFIAVPSGVIAALFFFALKSSWGTEAFARLPPGEQLEQTRSGVDADIVRLEREIAAATAKLDRFWVPSSTRERLRREVTSNRRKLEELRKLQAAMKERGWPDGRTAESSGH
ncbi:MAG: hypothetical protein KJ054_06625 [Gammaproteobacteria bacterium]|nr:hypothetical protein [Gammaproteobacteria bacterium]